MKVIFYSTKVFEIEPIRNANKNGYKLSLFSDPLNMSTVELARGHDAVCVFTNDDVSGEVLKKLSLMGIKNLATRAVGYDNIDVEAAKQLKIAVANVPDYSPNAVAEHAIMMMLSLIKKNKTTEAQIQKQNFSIDNIIGSNVQGKTIGLIGTGKIGSTMAKLLNGFDVKLLAYDLKINTELKRLYNVTYLDLESLCKQSDIITIHLPLNAKTKYLIDDHLLSKMKYKVIIINTARGSIVNTSDLIKHLKSKQIGGYGMDVYEFERGVFFFNHENNPIKDKLLLELISLKNVLVTPHQAFATDEAIYNIANTTFHNLYCWENNIHSENEINSNTNEIKTHLAVL